MKKIHWKPFMTISYDGYPILGTRIVLSILIGLVVGIVAGAIVLAVGL